MKKILLMLLAAGLFFAFTEKSYSVQNNLNIHLASEGGEIDTVSGSQHGDTALGEFGIEFAHYFSDLTTDDRPLGMREFLQHPSYFFISNEGTATALDYDPIFYEEDTREGMLIFGGGYYPGNTGFNIALVSVAIEIEEFLAGVKQTDIDARLGGLMFGIEHYLQDNVSISASLMSLAGEVDMSSSPVDIDIMDKTFSLGVQALLNNNVSLAFEISKGKFEWDDPTIEDTESKGHGLHIGYFTSNNNEIYFFHENSELEKTSETVTNGIGDKIYVTENFFLKGELYGVSVDYIDNAAWATEERGGLDLEVGFYF